MKKKTLFCCCALLSLFTILSFTESALHLDNTSLNSAYNKFQGLMHKIVTDGPGSYPPKCTGKCGDCNPCVPVHVPVPPGEPVTSEYYPEAWRCKCGNKLFMP